jgi:LysM repeat protein
MQSTHARRLGVLAGPVVLGALMLASCGGTEEAATQSTIDLSQASTAFVVRPPATTVPPEGDPAETTTPGQDYVVQAGDYPLKLVAEFGVTLEDLVAINEWGSVNEFPGPGTTIKIPPGVAPAATGDATGDAAAAAETAEAGSVAAIPDAGDNCAPGEHTIVSGDYPISVAKKYDVTVEALAAANSGNPAYSQFIVGQKIVIPAKSDC